LNGDRDPSRDGIGAGDDARRARTGESAAVVDHESRDLGNEGFETLRSRNPDDGFQTVGTARAVHLSRRRGFRGAFEDDGFSDWPEALLRAVADEAGGGSIGEKGFGFDLSLDASRSPTAALPDDHLFADGALEALRWEVSLPRASLAFFGGARGGEPPGWNGNRRGDSRGACFSWVSCFESTRKWRSSARRLTG
jgi:hypothetical protein